MSHLIHIRSVMELVISLKYIYFLRNGFSWDTKKTVEISKSRIIPGKSGYMLSLFITYMNAYAIYRSKNESRNHE